MILVTIDYNFKHVATHTCPVIPLNNVYLIVRTKMKLLNISLSLRRQYSVTNVSPVLMDTHSVNTYCTVKQNQISFSCHKTLGVFMSYLCYLCFLCA
jgi:hypothetical protein